MEYNVVYAADDNYAQYMAVSIVSLLENNKNADQINIYVLSLGITAQNMKQIDDIVNQYNRVIQFIDCSDLAKSLKLNMPWQISIATYLRLFIAQIVRADKALYLDCDIIVAASIENLWATDFAGKAVAGIIDVGSDNSKTLVGMNADDQYINAGVLLINLNFWRENDVQSRLIQFINNHNGRVYHHDQGVINAVLNKEKVILPPQYNLMTGYVCMSLSQLQKHYKMNSIPYSQADLDNAIMRPVIVHYTPFYTYHPWEKGCKNPLKDLFFQYRNLTKWANEPLVAPKTKPAVKCMNWIYTNLPFFIAEFANACLGHFIRLWRHR